MVSPRFSYMISNHKEAYASVNLNSPPKLLRVSRDQSVATRCRVMQLALSACWPQDTEYRYDTTGKIVLSNFNHLSKVTPELFDIWMKAPNRSHICAGTGLNQATSAPGLGSPLPHLRRDWGSAGSGGVPEHHPVAAALSGRSRVQPSLAHTALQ